jgi:transcriptional regulator with XRE-family HTH domain
MLLDINMTTKRGIPPEQKKAEGQRLKALWLTLGKPAYKTQEKFCEEFGLNQGFLQQWFSGSSAVPIETLLDIAIDWKFSPTEVRPEILDVFDKFILALSGQDRTVIEARLHQIGDTDYSSVVTEVERLTGK